MGENADEAPSVPLRGRFNDLDKDEVSKYLDDTNAYLEACTGDDRRTAHTAGQRLTAHVERGIEPCKVLRLQVDGLA